jgi:rubrerythrin
MSEKPSYLGTLNAIVNGERRGFEILNAWSAISPDPEISLMLKTVALREAEHAATFEKRMCELGFTLREKEDSKFQKTMSLVCSDRSDLEKFEKLGYNKSPDEADSDELLQLLADKSIDPQTGALLGRFIAEERDSARILREGHLCAKMRGNGQRDATPEDQVTLGQICAQLEKLTEAVAELQTTDKVTRVRAVQS